MRIPGRTVLTVAVLAGWLMIGVAGASAASSDLVPLNYDVKGLPAYGTMEVQYDGGVDETVGGSAQASSGAIRSDAFLDDLSVNAAAPGPLDAYVTQWVSLSHGPVTGVASFPEGTSITLANGDNGQTIDLPHGKFSISTAADLRSGGWGSDRTVTCEGNERSCEARIDLASESSDRSITIKLPARDMQLRSVTADPSPSKDAYNLSIGRFENDRTEYVVNLSAARTDPAGAHLILRFDAGQS